jgi:hypothetical protein
VHHSTKYEDVFRGAGALDADLDGMILVKKAGPKKDADKNAKKNANNNADKTPEERAADLKRLLDGNVEDAKKPSLVESREIDVSAIHFRDADPFEPFRVALELVEVMTDEGPQLAPAVKDRIDRKADEKSKTKVDLDLNEMIGVLRVDLNNGATRTSWMVAMREKKGWSEATFDRRLRLVKERGLVIGGGGRDELYHAVLEGKGA